MQTVLSWDDGFFLDGFRTYERATAFAEGIGLPVKIRR